jgi:hypothetical protein
MDGSVVKTEMNEMRVNADGQLQGRSSVKTIKTTPSLNKIALASSLPDSTLLALDEVTVYSDKGHTLRVKVTGFARVPVLNSRCGNLVHFYSSQGRITLDSTDISFDKETEAQFKDAGFSLAVGGYGGRRLAGVTKAQGFFKHVDKLRRSGAWTCADVALPAPQKTYMSRHSDYEACVGHACYSRYGGLKLGVAKIDEAHALAAMPVTSRIRALLKGSASEAYYMRTETTTLLSEGYTLAIETWPAHFGQEKIRLTSYTTEETAIFQSEIGVQNIDHCTSSRDASWKGWMKLFDEQPDNILQLEFVGLAEEGGKVLRHWRWFFALAAGSDAATGPGEMWDFADTMVPYRSVSTEGKVSVTESFASKCTDADVSEALAQRTSETIKNLLACKVHSVQALPQMKDEMADLDEVSLPYYITEVFGSLDSARRTALAADAEMSPLADYLVRAEEGTSKGSVSDPCYLECKDALDYHAQNLDCEANIAARECLQNSHPECATSEWMGLYELSCLGKASSEEVRALEDDSEEQQEPDSILVPATQAGVADLTRASPSFQSALASTQLTRMPKIVLNVTRKLTTVQPRRLVQRDPLCWAWPSAGQVGGKRKIFQWGYATLPKGLGSGHVSKKCQTCRWGPCLFQMQTILLPGKLDGMSEFWCLSFSFCLSKDITIVIMFKFDFLGGYFIFSLILEICVTVQLFGIPSPPFIIVICVGGQLHVFTVHGCKNVAPVCLMGGGYFRITFFVLFSFMAFTLEHTLTAIRISVEVGVVLRGYTGGCWRDERRRRRHTWHLRRRNKQKCHRWQACDSYQKIYVGWILPAMCAGPFCIPPGIWKICFEDTKWTTSNERTGHLWLELKYPKNVYNIFDVCFQKVWGRHECYRKAGNPSDPNTQDGVRKTAWRDANPIPWVKCCQKWKPGKWIMATLRPGVMGHKWIRPGPREVCGSECDTPVCAKTWNLWNLRQCATALAEAKERICGYNWNCERRARERMEKVTCFHAGGGYQCINYFYDNCRDPSKSWYDPNSWYWSDNTYSCKVSCSNGHKTCNHGRLNDNPVPVASHTLGAENMYSRDRPDAVKAGARDFHGTGVSAYH